jgi:hypothetical protein
VLVALAFDNFTSDRQDRRYEREYLARLSRDLRTDSAMLSEFLDVARRGEEASLDLLTYLREAQQSAADSTIARALSDATRGAYLAANRPTFSELTSTGNIRLIRSRELRNALFNYYASVERFQRSLETVMKRGKDPLGELGWDIHAYDQVLSYAVNLGNAPTSAKSSLDALPAESIALVDRFRRAPNAAIATRRALTYNGLLQPIVAEWYVALDAVRRMLPDG